MCLGVSSFTIGKSSMKEFWEEEGSRWKDECCFSWCSFTSGFSVAFVLYFENFL